VRLPPPPDERETHVTIDTRKTVFLTGVTGNMGREALRRIATRSDTLRLKVLIRPEEQDNPVAKDIRQRGTAEIVVGDLTDAASIQAGVRGADIVLHVGGLVSPLADRMPPEIVTAVNVGGARNIVDAIHRVGDPDRTRLVYIGTVAQTGSRNAPIHWGRTGDPIMFHNPLNGVFESSTANDSGRLMAAVCDDAVPTDLWRGFYNIGGGATSRVVNHEFMSSFMPQYRKVLRPHWQATRNFHGQWYVDSDRLQALVPFREQSIRDYLTEAPRHMPALARLAPKCLPGLVHKRVKGMAEAPGGTLRWFADDDRAKIDAYFESRAAWERIPRDWDGYPLKQPSRKPTILDHGYDETRPSDAWQLDDLKAAADYRGARCHAESFAGSDVPIDWTCAAGHRFAMTPNLYLRGGHWYPTCMLEPSIYAEEAARNAFFGQVWRKDADA